MGCTKNDTRRGEGTFFGVATAATAATATATFTVQTSVVAGAKSVELLSDEVGGTAIKKRDRVALWCWQRCSSRC